VDNEKIEIPHQTSRTNHSDNNKSPFNWVTERSHCSLPNVFHTLLQQVEDDVKTRNALRPEDSPYQFSLEENGADFSVVLTAGDVRDSVVFALREHAILVRSGADKQLFEITLDFTSEGECKLVVNDQQRDFWQVRRMALEGLMFHSN
jgi:hypothetical protein